MLQRSNSAIPSLKQEPNSNFLKHVNDKRVFSRQLTSSRDVLHEETKLLRMITRIVGMNPLYHSHIGGYRVKWISPLMLYTVCMIVLNMYQLIALLLLRTGQLITKTITYDEKLTISITIIHPFCHLLPLISLFEVNKICTYLNSWQSFQIQYFQTAGKRLNFNLKRSSTVNFIIAITVTVFISTTFYFDYLRKERGRMELSAVRNMQIHQHVSIAHSIWVAYVVQQTWSTFNKCLRSCSVQLQADIKLISEGRLMKSFKSYQRLWYQLHELTSQLGEAFCFTILSILLLSLILGIIALYSVLSGFFSQWVIPSMFISGCIILFFLTWIPTVACGTTKMVHEMTNRLLVEVEHSLLTQEQHKEIENFRLLMNQNPTYINLGGYVNLHKSTISSVMTNIVTYMIILMQFRLTKEG